MTVPVSIKVIKDTPRLQDTEPFSVCKVRTRQIPCNISCYNHIKTVAFHIERLRVACFPHNTLCKLTCIALCFFQHFFGIINCSNLIPGFCKKNCKKSRAGSYIENFNLLRFLFRKLISKQKKEFVPPHRSTGICHFLLIIF